MSREILNLAIVTSCHNYGKYLEDWATSIVEQVGYYPAIVVIVDNGSTDLTPRYIVEAMKILEEADIPALSTRIPYCNFGKARNEAVRLSGQTEWVTHFDADDMLMSHALSDFKELAPNADVVGFGYQRSGDLKAGPSNRTRVYSTHQGKKTLRSTAPASGVSPFRRRFWENTPYREDMDGGWDTALWIGFAHQSAQFVPTKRPVFFYRQHADSIFNVRRNSDRKGAFVGSKLRDLRKNFTGVSVIIPWMSDGGHRDRIWKWIEGRYEEMHPDYQVVKGISPEPWRKGLAVQDGIAKATGQVIAVIDADCIVNSEALEEAVELVERGVPWVVPHTMVRRLDKDSTERLISEETSTGNRFVGSCHRKPYKGYAGGGAFVIDRSNYNATGGIPEAFEGWGAEDEALAVILDTLVGPHIRLEPPIYHLWHPQGPRRKDPRYESNRSLYRQLLQCIVDPDLMWETLKVIQQGGDPSDVTVPRKGRVMMVALETHMRGTEKIEKGRPFKVTEVEARRYEARSRRIARRINGLDMSVVRRYHKSATLDIRSEQSGRNDKEIREKTRKRRELMDRRN